MVRRAREAYFKEFNFDLKALCDDLMQRQAKSAPRPVSPPRRKHTQQSAGK
jgi:hypothetical protein